MSVAPYPGLRPYDEEERDNFFGRETDSKILIDQILANRLTLLFAATGVGKSSLLRASVIPRLKEPLGENLDVVFFNDWVASPLPNLKRVILTTLHEQGDLEQDVIEQEVVDAPLSGFLEFCCLFTSQPFLIVLDQFEEFFRYRGNYPKEHSQALIDQLTEVILNKAIPVAVVLSMREDYALELNDFKPRLPMILFENYYRLEKLTREAAMDAIQIPAQRVGFKYEGVLFELLLTDLLSRELDRSKGSMVADTIETVEPPYLQIICSQLWMRDQNDPEKTIRYITYEKAGGAKGLLDNFIGQDVMSKFSFAEKQLASKAFDHLVSRRGTKMPHTVEDLSQMLNVNPDELRKVLDKLEQNRVLRRQQREKKVWYELYHDMFSHSIDDWNTAWKNRMRVRRSIIGGVSAAAVGAILLVGYDVWVNASSTHLRMSLSDPYSMVELWQGKQGAWDLFGQQRFISQLDIKVKDREPDKRLPRWPVNDNIELGTELIGTLPLNERVTAFSQDGQHDKALDIARDSISDAEVARSKSVVANIIGIHTEMASRLLWDSLLYVSRDSLREVVKSGLSMDRFAYWLDDEKHIIKKMKVAGKQQKIALLEKLSKLAVGGEGLSMMIEQLKDADPDVRSSIAQALGWLGFEEALPELISHLKDSNSEVRSSIVQALGKLNNKKALPALIVQIEDDDPDVRSNVIYVLGQLGGEEVLPKIISRLNDESPQVRSSIAKVLGTFDSKESMLFLAEQLKDADASVRSNAINALGRMGRKEVLPILVEQLNNDNVDVRSSIMSALGELGGERSFEVLMGQLEDMDSDVRINAMRVLDKKSYERALPFLIKLAKDKNSNVRSSVLEVLWRLGGVDVLPLLVDQLEDGQEYVRYHTVEALNNFGSGEVVPFLIRKLKNGNPAVRSSVIGLLGRLGGNDIFPILIAQLDDNDEDVRSSVIEALGYLGNSDALPILMKQQVQGDVIVRSSLARLLGQIGREDMLPMLVTLLKDDAAVVRSSAAQALGKLGSEESLPLLLAQLNDDDVDVRSSVAQACKRSRHF